MRAIDADALRKQLEEYVGTGTEEFDKGYDLGLQKAIELLDDAPTITPEKALMDKLKGGEEE